MYKVSEFTKRSYKTGEVAKLLSVTTKTIQIYDRLGKLKVCRTEGDRRMILREDLLEYLNKKGLLIDDTIKQKCDVIYARVSSGNQKKQGGLDRQVIFLVEHVRTLQNPIILKEVGSGLNDKRKELQKLFTLVNQGEIRNVYITYKDRLTRFGYHYIETMFAQQGVQICVVQDEEAKKSVQEELVEDMMSLLASFSGKLYGMRSGKNRKKEGKEN